jgi:ribosome maturation factor RimP
MIKKEKIIRLVEEELGNEMFLVDVKVSKSNVINVFIDGMNGITIEQCVAISRKIESNLDREVEDFELLVSSAGLGQPFKVIQQYYKNVGKKIEVISIDGEKQEGILTEVSEKGIKLKITNNVKIEGSRKKQMVIEDQNFEFENIKSAKTIISFNI